MGIRLTDKFLKNLVAPESGNRIAWDSEIRGFGVRITAQSVKSFIFDYRISGRQRRLTIGRTSELTILAARIRAGELRARILDGADPMEERMQTRSEPTMADLAADYLERHALPNKRKSSVRDDRMMLEKVILPKVGNLRIKAIRGIDIEGLHGSLKRTPFYGNRVLSLLSKMFNLAMRWGYIGENPTMGIQRFHEEPRECSLSSEEIQRLRKALEAYPDQIAANALRLLMLTGSRGGEVLKAEWAQFDFQSRVWTKPSHNTKQKRVEHIPIGKEVVEILLSMMPKEAIGPIFPGKSGGARVSLRRPWIQVCRAAGLVDVEIVQGKRGPKSKYRPSVRIHDLRHIYASQLVSNGVQLHVVGKLLGHTQPATTMRYAHLQDKILREANNVFEKIYFENDSKQPE